ncbi:MAG: DNA-primase RepB domain-containing protein [Thiothrix sp.]|uniref:DNA-primase RepB domain-containing protein n=1 Tax=Thiothrix sp. TaxID=1032 RepID=UPI002629DC75|nr:DNA-primase RepB domain-containing protein [Thiothrix sp.]MDD5395481.1 DNA-primase RepB domain-containing protein [Thiothrix sp.]
MRVLEELSKEAGVFAWEWGWVVNPKADRSGWRWEFGKCRNADLRKILAKMRQKNARGCDIYLRPVCSKNEDSIIQYPFFVLDDVDEAKAREIANTNRALVVKTSTEGGCQVWIFTRENLTRTQRLVVQQHYQKKIGSDVGAVSGVQFSRAPCFKNYKRGGQWVNVVGWPRGDRLSVAHLLQPITKDVVESAVREAPRGATPPVPSPRKSDCDCSSQSEADFAWCVRQLKNGVQQKEIVARLAQTAGRKGRHAEGYAVRTVAAAARFSVC